MASKQISQAEARRLKRRVKELEDRDRHRFSLYRRDYPGGVSARTFSMNEASKVSLDLACRLGCALVAKIRGDQLVIFAVSKESV